MVQIIKGKEIAENLCGSIKIQIEDLKKRGITPRIALVNAGDDPASKIYVSKKEKLAESLGISSAVYALGNEVKEEKIAKLIEELNNDQKIHAILLQSPLPEGLSFRKLVDLIRPDKDVDGLTTINQGRLFTGENCVVPCTPLGVLHLLKTVHEKIAGLHVVILGRSYIVGRPLAQLLLNNNCSVTSLHSYSRDLPFLCKAADIVISAIGKPMFIGRDFIKKGATVIDVGITRIEQDGKKKIVGDVNFNEVSEIAGAITPVPNGVGPMTVACLMQNTLSLAIAHCIS
ncbi:MAG: bifunctional methylenetetrahydrofolate dehydrogenase/methenyltetrahydrofolate cyclohydrolase [Holosporaceae bacterium]|jgi:methylenetetrahydrofolate dehydrogenase (NADP+)/methenyltetrahydrofolate cyclohydrolase|nr:bifunctional methylenetetrahydrofolate dehydrogenase/methenyltetrahydrofolate cyclohydrolase [Holosporaceae bacterium]